MKIAIVGTRGIPGRYSGIEVSMDEIAKAFGKKGYQVIVYCRKSQSDTKSRDLYENVRLIFIPTVDSKHFGTIIHVFLSTLHLLFSNVDIVHFHSLGPSLVSFLPRLFGKKVVVTVHALDWKRKKWGVLARYFLRACEYSAMLFPHKTIVVSKSLREYFKQKFKKKVSYIPNAVVSPSPTSNHHSTGSGDQFILFTGRLVPEKGIQYLIKAFNDLKTNMKLLIAGEASYTDDYVSCLKGMAHKNIEFAGPVSKDELDRLYRNAQLFILPSEVEGSPVSLLEAMSYGRCVLVSDIPECLEIIGDTGVSFRSQDIGDLKEKLHYLLHNRDCMVAKGIKARQRVLQEYNWKKIIKRLEGVYSSLCLR